MKANDIIEDSYNTGYFNETNIISIIKALINEYELEDYVKNIFVNVNKNKSYGQYFPETSEIYISSANILDSISKWYKYEYLELSDIAFMRLSNMLVLETIEHELTHVKQTKESELHLDDSLHKIINEGIEFGRRFPKNISFYEKTIYYLFYNKILIERNANIMAIINLLKRNEEINLFGKRELSFLKKELFNWIKYGYSENSCPAKKYYFLRGKSKEYETITFDEEYDYTTTISWGLPINKKSLNEIKNNSIQKIITKSIF